MSNSNDQIFDPFEDDSIVVQNAASRAMLRRILRQGPGQTIVTKITFPENKPGLIYYDQRERYNNPDYTEWIDSTSLYDPLGQFALLDAGTLGWGLKMHPEKFCTGFEDYYFQYGSLNDNDQDDNQIYLIRFHNTTAYNDFKLTSWFTPMHLFAPVPLSEYIADIFIDTNQAQMYSWRKQFAGSGFSDMEIQGIVNYHRDFDQMNILFLGDISSLNMAYRYLGGVWEKNWVLHNLKDEGEEE